MRVEFSCAMLRVEVRTERDYPDLQDEAEELFEVDVVHMSCARMAKVLANRLLALHRGDRFWVAVAGKDLSGSSQWSD